MSDEDIRKVRMAQEAIQGKALIRLDANQGYTLPQAKKFVQNIDPRGIEFLEQPFKENEWEAMVRWPGSLRSPWGWMNRFTE